MSFEPTLTQLANAASGLLFIGVALFVWKVASRERANLAFTLFAGGFGLRITGWYLSTAFTPGSAAKVPLLTLTLPGGLLMLVGILLFALWYPHPPKVHQRRLLVAPAAVGVLALVLQGVGMVSLTRGMTAAEYAEAFNIPVSMVTWIYVEEAVFRAALAGLVLLLALLAARYAAASGPRRARERAAMALTGAAFATYVGLNSSSWVLIHPTATGRATHLAVTALVVVVAAAWLRAGTRAEGAEARWARNVGLYILTMLLAGALVVVAGPGGTAVTQGPQWAAARLVMVLLLAYAVVRHQLLGIDVKVRWGISKGTVAAVFVGVFFMVSEAAQVFFAGAVGSEYLGILVAGTLVFAIAPLQRAADRVAERVVPPPHPADASGASADQRATRFRAAAALALRDRRLTREEERTLLLLAEDLGIPLEDALELLDDAGQRQDADL